MRKCILLIIIIIATNACVSAQYVTFGRAFSFGHAYITDKNASQQFLFSLTGGLSISYADNEHYGYAADIVYSTEGGKSKYNIGGADFNTKTKLSYIRMPLKYIIFLFPKSTKTKDYTILRNSLMAMAIKISPNILRSTSVPATPMSAGAASSSPRPNTWCAGAATCAVRPISKTWC